MANQFRSLTGVLGAIGATVRELLVDMSDGTWARRVATVSLGADGATVATAANPISTQASTAELRRISPTGNWRQLASTADQNPSLISASARALHYVRGDNATAGIKYLKIYDKATQGGTGDTPLVTIALLASAGFDLDFKGLPIALGLSYRITGAAADADATNIAASDILGLNIGWST